MTPPERFRTARFRDYEPQTPSQEIALEKAKAFVRLVRVQNNRPGWFRLRRRKSELRGGLYLVGPVGTGKTHLLASIYHALSDPPEGQTPVLCAYTHSSELFRATETPQVYARRVAQEARVLCLDEVELDDPAAEVRLIGVLKALREEDVTIAATSNAEPDRFVSAAYGRNRLERFLTEEFRQQYHVVVVGGDDFRQRLEKPGKAWIGDPEETRRAMAAAFETSKEPKRWLTFLDLLKKTVDIERSRLTADFASLDTLCIEGIQIETTDDALRLLRVMDDLYGAPSPPTIYFTSESPPSEWFSTNGRTGIESGIAEKFTRTTSRLAALAEVVAV